jgi:glycosyltransferase involved in cell wall biosynthesis
MIMSNTKICLVIMTLDCGGAERMMSEFANYAANLGFEIHLILLYNKQPFYNLNSSITLYSPSFSTKKNSRILYAIKLLPFVRKILKQIKPHTVLSFDRGVNPFIIIAAAFMNLSVYISDRGNPYEKGNRLDDLLRNILYKKATGIIAQTKGAKDFMSDVIKSKNVKVIPNAVRHIKQYSHERENIIAFMGRLIPAKGVKYLIKAFSELNNESWKVLILGDGCQKQELMDMVETLNMKEQIEFLGNVKNVDYFLSKSKIFVFPSLSEGFPNALVEAMANSLACISFDCMMGPRDLIENGKNGFLVEPGDIECLKTYLYELMNNRELREKMQHNAHTVNTKLRQDIIFSQYLDFILEIHMKNE